MGILHQLYLEYRNSLEQANQDQKNPQSVQSQNTIQSAHNQNTAQHSKQQFLQCLNSSPVEELYQQDEKGYSILAYAALYDDTETLTSVLNKIPRFKATDIPHYFVPLLCAVNKKNETHVKLFLDHDADINAFQEGTGFTLLHYTTLNGDQESTKLLLKLGADIRAKNNFEQQFAAGGQKSIFDVAFNSETKDVAQKIDLLNYLFLWAWSKDITVDLTDIKINSSLTTDLIVLNAYRQQKPVTRQTPLFSRSFTHFDELLDPSAFKYTLAPHINYEDIYSAIKRRIEDGDSNPQLHVYAKQFREKWLATTAVELKEFIGQTLFSPNTAMAQKSDDFKKARESLSADLKQQVDTLADKLEIIPGKTAQNPDVHNANKIPAAPLSEEELLKQKLSYLF